MTPVEQQATQESPVAKGVPAAQELVARLTGRPPEATRWALSYLQRTHAYSTARTRERLGWEPQVALAEGMRRTEAWLRAEGLLG